MLIILVFIVIITNTFNDVFIFQLFGGSIPLSPSTLSPYLFHRQFYRQQFKLSERANEPANILHWLLAWRCEWTFVLRFRIVKEVAAVFCLCLTSTSVICSFIHSIQRPLQVCGWGSWGDEVFVYSLAVLNLVDIELQTIRFRQVVVYMNGGKNMALTRCWLVGFHHSDRGIAHIKADFDILI